MTTERETGELLQRHGTSGETRAHWHEDDGGGRWVAFVHWQLFDGKWTARPAGSLSETALAELIRLRPPGEPRVVSGTDAGEGTVAKPDHVAVGQRWRDMVGTFTVQALLEPNFWHCQGMFAGWGWPGGRILACKYLGTVPAPAETPPTLSPCARCGKRNARESDMCKQCIDDTAETPAPPGPVEPEPATVHAYDGGRLTVCGASVEGKSVDTDEGHPRVTCGACLSLATPAAPAPGVGEGARELTFAEAMKGLERGEKWRRRAWFDGLWTKRGPGLAGLHVYADDKPQAPVSFADMLATDWELLPAPAPKPGRGRVFEMFDAEIDRVRWTNTTVLPFAERVAREALACVRRHLANHVIIVQPGSPLAAALDAAALELLGAEAGK